MDETYLTDIYPALICTSPSINICKMTVEIGRDGVYDNLLRVSFGRDLTLQLFVLHYSIFVRGEGREGVF